MYTTISSTDALASAQRARVLAERALRRSELERDQIARALELDLPPRDEGERDRLRSAHADAAASVTVNRKAFDRAVSLERAAALIVAAIEDEAYADSAVVDGLVQLLEQRQRRQREIAPPVTARTRRPSPDARATQR